MNIIKYNSENLFPPYWVYFGYGFFIFIPVALLNSNFLGSVVMIFLGYLLAFSKTGIQIRLDTKQYRYYSKYFGLYSGKWLSTNKLPYICSLQFKRSQATITPHLLKGPTFQEQSYEVYLLNSTHRKKVLLNKLDSKKKALTNVKFLADVLSKEYVKYSPVISAKTAARKRR